MTKNLTGKTFGEWTVLHKADKPYYYTCQCSCGEIKDVSQMKSGKYRAYINLKRKQHHLGVFDTLEEAEKARKEAEKELYKPVIKRYKK